MASVASSSPLAGSGGSAFGLDETAPGRYEGYAPLGSEGLADYEILDPTSGARASAWAWIPPRLESSRLGPDYRSLSLIASSTGGRLLSSGTLEPPAPTLRWRSLAMGLPLLGAAALLFVAELYLRSTMTGQSPGRRRPSPRGGRRKKRPPRRRDCDVAARRARLATPTRTPDTPRCSGGSPSMSLAAIGTGKKKGRGMPRHGIRPRDGLRALGALLRPSSRVPSLAGSRRSTQSVEAPQASVPPSLASEAPWLVAGPFPIGALGGLEDALDRDYLATSGMSSAGEAGAAPLRLGGPGSKLLAGGVGAARRRRSGFHRRLRPFLLFRRLRLSRDLDGEPAALGPENRVGRWSEGLDQRRARPRPPRRSGAQARRGRGRDIAREGQKSHPGQGEPGPRGLGLQLEDRGRRRRGQVRRFGGYRSRGRIPRRARLSSRRHRRRSRGDRACLLHRGRGEGRAPRPLGTAARGFGRADRRKILLARPARIQRTGDPQGLGQGGTRRTPVDIDLAAS